VCHSQFLCIFLMDAIYVLLLTHVLITIEKLLDAWLLVSTQLHCNGMYYDRRALCITMYIFLVMKID